MSPPITLVREGTWAKGEWQEDGPGGVGYYPVKLSKDARIVGTEFEWPGGFAPPEDGVILYEPVTVVQDNGDGTRDMVWYLHVKYVERRLLVSYETRIEFTLRYTVTYDTGKTWSRASYRIESFSGPKF